MTRDLCYFYPCPLNAVYGAFVQTAAQKLGKDCKQTPMVSISFGLNFSMKYNMNGGACTIHFMPYQNGTAINIRYSVVQLMGARYKKHAQDLTLYANNILRANAQPAKELSHRWLSLLKMPRQCRSRLLLSISLKRLLRQRIVRLFSSIRRRRDLHRVLSSVLTAESSFLRTRGSAPTAAKKSPFRHLHPLVRTAESPCRQMKNSASDAEQKLINRINKRGDVTEDISAYFFVRTALLYLQLRRR